MKKISLALISLSLIASGCSTQPVFAPSHQLNSALSAQSVSTSSKAPSETVKHGNSELTAKATQGTPKQAAPAPQAPAGEIPALPRHRGNLSQSEIATMARIGLRSMDRARTWESGYEIGYQTLRSLSRENSYIARLTAAAVRPQMKYESAYKATAHGLEFISRNRDISVHSAVTLIRQMMDSSKTWEDGARMGYATIDFISQTAEPGIRRVLQSTRYSAKAARTWEDAYHVMYEGYGQVRYMN